MKHCNEDNSPPRATICCQDTQRTQDNYGPVTPSGPTSTAVYTSGVRNTSFTRFRRKGRAQTAPTISGTTHNFRTRNKSNRRVLFSCRRWKDLSSPTGTVTQSTLVPLSVWEVVAHGMVVLNSFTKRTKYPVMLLVQKLYGGTQLLRQNTALFFIKKLPYAKKKNRKNAKGNNNINNKQSRFFCCFFFLGVQEKMIVGSKNNAPPYYFELV